MKTRRMLVGALTILLAICMGAALVGCGRQTAKAHSITVAGSTSVQPFVEVLAEEYAKKFPDMSVNVQGGGSSAGIQAATVAAAEIGMSSRALKPAEKSAVNPVLIAYDSIAVVVHPSNPIRNIDIGTLRRIFAGEITSWKHLGWVDRQITVISREEGSGTRGAFDEMVMGTAAVSSGCLVQDSNGSVRETVAQDHYALGYVSLGLVNDSVQALSLGGVAPTFEASASGEYMLVRPFLFVVKGEPTGLARDFIDYVLGAEGQRILGEEGLIPTGAGKTR